MTTASPAPRVREATIDDVRTIVEYNRLLALETENKELDCAVLTLGVELGLAQPAMCRYFLAEVRGQVVGQTMVTFEWSDWRAGVFWWIQSVYVEQPCRGTGVFRALHDHIRTLARAAPNVCGLRLYVEHENHPALATYRKLGMSPTGHLLFEDDWSGATKHVAAEAAPRGT